MKKLRITNCELRKTRGNRPNRRNSLFRTSNLRLLLFLISSLIPHPSSFAENWPQWRGPRGDGTSEEKNLPVKWSATENVAWKAAIRGKGESTPIVWGDRIFLTYQVGDNPTASFRGPNTPKPGQDLSKPIRLFTACYSAKDGKLLWENEAKGGQVIPTHEKHNEASPSCVTDGEFVYAWFGTGPIECYDFDGKVVWQRDLAVEYGAFEIQFGHGSSPALYEDKLILPCDHSKTAYILAADKKSGKNIWKIDREAPRRSYSTPLVVRVEDHDEMLFNTGGRIEAFNPKNGEFLWKANGLNIVVVPMPVYANGIVYTQGGWSNGPAFAVRPGGEGDVTESRVIWSKKTGATYVPSSVFAGDAIYFINDDGIASCLDAKTGDQVWKERVGGKFSSSPVVADGKIYQTSEEGETVVLDASRTFKVVGKNPIHEPTLASIAISDGKIFLRTEKSLFCISGGEK